MAIRNSGLKQHTAAELATLCLRHAAELEAFLAHSPSDDSDLSAARPIVGRIMGEMYLAALYPIFRDYPDLRPQGFPDSKA